MTTPAAPAPKPAAAPSTPDHAQALSAAVTAIAKHITGSSDDRHALVVLGLTSEQATAITGG